MIYFRRSSKSECRDICESKLIHPVYRGDIDGLRALAVLSVVLFHAFPYGLPGGFIGVDIFFVISGYLISTIIFRNMEQHTFSIVEFYKRRIRRIFPALIVVLVSTALIGGIVLIGDEYKNLGKHIFTGAAFVSNITLWSESGYFDILSSEKPLLHLWSLGIEEQFYIFWPIMVSVLWKNKSHFLVWMISIFIVSFILNLWMISAYPVADFYWPITRFWELLCGAGIAWRFINQQEVMEIYHNKFVRHIISFAGLALVVSSLFILARISQMTQRGRDSGGVI